MPTDVIALGDRVVNSWLLTLENGRCLLVDTGYPGGFPAFCKRLARHGLAPGQIDYILLTHAHDDHAGFVREVLQASEARLILHPAGMPAMARGQNSFAGGCTGLGALLFCRVLALLGKGEHRFAPLSDSLCDRVLLLTGENRANLSRALGVAFLDTPGHTACSVSLLTPQGLFCGDAAMNGFPSRNHITIWAEDLAQYDRSLAAIQQAEPRMLYPGHGRPFPVAALTRARTALTRLRLHPLAQAKARL